MTFALRMDGGGAPAHMGAAKRAAAAGLAEASVNLLPLATPDHYVLEEEAPVAAPAARKRGFAVRPGLFASAVFVILLVVAAIDPALLTPLDPQAADARDAFLSPGLDHWLGADENGRDVLARLIYGARSSLLMGVLASLISVGGGVAIGLAAGLGGKVVDGVLMRFIDVLMAFPQLLMALAIITFWGQGISNAIVAVGVASIPQYARLARAQSQLVRNTAYVEAATTLGLRRATLIWRHVLPNSIKPVIVLATIGVGTKISYGAALSFLGFGAPPPAPEWGAMISVGRNFLTNAVWLVAAPGAAITLTVLSVTALGRELATRSEGKTT